jgi:hypothetical protein
MTSFPILKFLFRSEYKFLSDALNTKSANETQSFQNVADLISFFGTVPVGVVVAALNDKNDLLQIVTFFKFSKKFSSSVSVKILVINFSGDVQFEKALSRVGILDVVDQRAQSKALKFKIDFLLKSLTGQAKNIGQSMGNSPSSALGDSNSQAIKLSESIPHWVDPINCKDDIWVTRHEQDCKKVLKRWMIKLMGPSPYVGQWVESRAPGIWKFQFNFDEEEYISGKGLWFYAGENKPEFVWTENVWMFAGATFELFYKDGKDIVTRVKLKNNKLKIAKNSEHAKSKVRKIIQSFDKDYIIQKELHNSAELELIDQDRRKYENLEGKGQTDKINSAPLAGKGETSHLNHNPLALDLQPGDNNLSSELLGYKPSKAGNSSEWNGDLEADQKTAGNLYGKLEGNSKKNASPNDLMQDAADKYWERNNGEEIERKGQNSSELTLDDEEEIEEEGDIYNFLDLEAEKKSAKDASKKDPGFAGGLKMQGARSSVIATEDESYYPEAKNKKPGFSSAGELPNSDSNVLPFTDKTNQQGGNEQVGKDLEEAIQNAKVTSKLTQNSSSTSCTLDDYFDQTIVFTTNEKVPPSDGLVAMDLNFLHLNKETSIKLNGRIVSVESDNEGCHYITVEISNENVSIFNTFIKLYLSRQSNIDHFLKAAKGF